MEHPWKDDKPKRHQFDHVLFLMVILPKTKSLRIQGIWYSQQLMDITFVYLHMGKLDQAKHSPFMVQIKIQVLPQGLLGSFLRNS